MNFLQGKVEANGETLMRLWKRAGRWPGGKLIFSKMASRMAPYTGTIKARIEALEPGYSKLTMADRPSIRNHLKSIHAIALANFIEETTGLAMLSSLPAGLRGIVTRIEVEYRKKARGTLSAECRAPAVDPTRSAEYVVETDVMDTAGDVVATGRAHWKIGPTRTSE